MIVAFSTSSRQASVALLAADGAVLWSGRIEAPQAASGACLSLLEDGFRQIGKELSDVTLFLSDLGPGSFTGVRVGVTLAKTLAFAVGAKAGGSSAFDLIDPHGVVVLPSKRGEWFVRRPGQQPERGASLPAEEFVGFGPGIDLPIYPDAVRFSALVANLGPVEPEALLPLYLIEPSISTPKKPYGAAVAQ